MKTATRRSSRTRAARTLLSALALFAAACSTAAAQVTVVRTIPGMNGPNPPENVALSADMMGGVSPTHLVGFINAGFSVRLKADGREVQPTQTLREFWTAAFKNAGTEMPGNPYDPRIFFDPMTKRWFATCNSNMGGMTRYMFIAVSADADPAHPWKAVDYEARVLVDNMKLGLDKNGFYTTALSGGREENANVPVIAIPKADLLWKGTAAPSLAHLNYMEVALEPRMGDKKYPGQEGMVPAFDLNPAKKPGDPAVFINRYRREVGGETIIQIRTVTWTSPTSATLSDPTNIGLGVHYTVQPTKMAEQPSLPGGLLSPPIRPGEARIVNAVVSGGSVWAIAGADVNDRAAAFWVEIDLKTMKLVQHGTLADPAAHIVFPSLNVDGEGNLGIAMTRVSATEAASTCVTGRLRGDPPNTLRPLVRAVEGKFVYFKSETDLSKPGQTVQWSDYSTVVMDPSDPMLFWSYQMAATNDCLPKETNGGRFGTTWVGFTVGRPGTKR
jgi:hypothetical protein